MKIPKDLKTKTICEVLDRNPDYGLAQNVSQENVALILRRQQFIAEKLLEVAEREHDDRTPE